MISSHLFDKSILNISLVITNIGSSTLGLLHEQHSVLSKHQQGCFEAQIYLLLNMIDC